MSTIGPSSMFHLLEYEDPKPLPSFGSFCQKYMYRHLTTYLTPPTQNSLNPSSSHVMNLRKQNAIEHIAFLHLEQFFLLKNRRIDIL